MRRRILQESLIVLVQTALLLLFAATWGIPGDDRPRAAAESPPRATVSSPDDCCFSRFFSAGPP